MKQIMTVQGPIKPEELGFTSMHEHTLFDAKFMRRRYEAFLPDDGPVKPNDPLTLSNLGILKHGFILSNDLLDMRDEDLITAELSDFKEMGGGAVADMSSLGLRVDPLSLSCGSPGPVVSTLLPPQAFTQKIRGPNSFIISP